MVDFGRCTSVATSGSHSHPRCLRFPTGRIRMATTSTAAGTAQFGVIGLGVMGQNLALNIRDHNYSVAVWNLEPEAIDSFLQKNGTDKLEGHKDLKNFVNSLS